MLSNIVNNGVKQSMSSQMARQVRMNNTLLLVLIGTGVFIFLPIVYEDGLKVVAFMDLLSIAFLASLLWINHLGYTNISRLLTSVYPPTITMAASITVKIMYPNQVYVYDFFDARVLGLAFFVLPFLLFSFNEKKFMLSALGYSFFLVAVFDPIHAFFGVGYIKFFGAMPKAYIVSGVYTNLALVFIAGCIYYFKATVEGLLQKNDILANDLGEKNMELSALFEELERANIKLTDQIEEKTAELRQSNDELINHNNDLQQFSNTLSHNLRGPVANLLGLAQLFKNDNDEESRTEVATHIFKSATTLDDVIKDLNKVVDLRNNLHQIKEKIDIKKEIEEIWFVLDQNVKQCNGKLILDINIPVLYGIRPYFKSVIYNLISNAIKYNHSKRDCIVRISANNVNEKCQIIVKDNGIGIDLEKYEDKLFGMYKRFHNHVDGKGLGLFLTKQQIEAMGGSITVESELNVGTSFIVKFPSFMLSQIESQLFYESEVANIYLDAANNITTLQWKKMPNPSEFSEVFSSNSEVFGSYGSENWIVDLKLITSLSELEKQWVLENVIEQYAKIGIKKIALIRRPIKKDSSFWDQFAAITKTKSLEVIFVASAEEAKDFLLKV